VPSTPIENSFEVAIEISNVNGEVEFLIWRWLGLKDVKGADVEFVARTFLGVVHRVDLHRIVGAAVT